MVAVQVGDCVNEAVLGGGVQALVWAKGQAGGRGDRGVDRQREAGQQVAALDDRLSGAGHGRSRRQGGAGQEGGRQGGRFRGRGAARRGGCG